MTSPPFDANGQYDANVLSTSVEKALDACVAQVACTDHIVAIGFDCFAMSLVGSDLEGKPVTKVFSYAERFSSTAKYTSTLRQRLARRNELDSTYQRTGAPIHSAYAGPTLMRLLHEEPETFARVACWQSFTSHLLQRWTDAKDPIPISYSEASWTGLYNRLEKTWDRTLLSIMGMSIADQQKLAPLVDYDGLPASLRLSPTMLLRFPRLSNARLFLGFGDGAMANIGSKCTDLTRVAVTVGTSAALRVVVPSDSIAQVPAGLWCYAIDGEHSLLGGALTDGGSVHAFLNRLLAKETEEEEGKEGEEREEGEREEGQKTRTEYTIGEHGLVVLPFLSGERSPGWKDSARATIHGLTRTTTRRDVRRAMYESVCLRLRSVMNLVSPFLKQQAVVLASGTALKSNPEWKAMMADALGRNLMVENSKEATSRGVALMVMKSLSNKKVLSKEKLDDDVEKWISKNSEAYERELIRQQDLYTQLYEHRSGGRETSVRALGAAVVFGVVLGCALSYFRPRL
jgi:gluconokinase